MFFFVVLLKVWRLGVLSKLSVKKSKRLIWFGFMGFIGSGKLFQDFAYEIVFCISGGERRRVPTKYFPRHPNNAFWIGYMDFIETWSFFSMLLMNCFLHLCRGDARGT